MVIASGSERVKRYESFFSLFAFDIRGNRTPGGRLK